MMARIEAGERLAAISDGALAAGNVHKFDARRAIRRLEEAQRGGQRKASKVTPAMLGGMGIGLRQAQPERPYPPSSKGPEEPVSDV